MIPIKLSMRNFMCYRESVSPLHFEGIHIACICGDNGNGKSALIDAMTWALWGKTRAKSDDDLIHMGQAEMEVEFDFAAGKQAYRIIRKRSRPKRSGGAGQTILEFQINTGDSFRSITGNSVAQTQQHIIDTLHMDYVTFVNSALLLQGHADEFTIKRPVERKEVLANILGLSFYDELEEQAKNIAKEQETEKAQHQSAIRDIDVELVQLPAYEAEFEQAQGELARIEKVMEEQESILNGLRQQKESLERKKSQLTQLEEHITGRQKELERWGDQLEKHRPRLKEHEELIARRSAIEEGYTRFIEAKESCDELEQKFRHLAALNERKHKLEMAIVEAGKALVSQHAVAQSGIEKLEAISRKLPGLKSELKQVQVQLHELAQREEALRGKRQNSQEMQAQIHHLESSETRLAREIGEIEEKLGLLSSQSGATCPLCETELGTEGRQRIEAKYIADKESKSDSFRSGEAELARKRIELKSFGDEVSRLEAGIAQDRASAQSKAGILDKEIAESGEAGEQLHEESEKLAEIEQHMAGKDFAITEQEALNELEAELAGLGYDPSQHEQVRQRLRDLGQYEGPKRKLEEADSLVKQEKEAVSRAEEAAQELRSSLELDTRKKQSLSVDLDLLPRLVGDLTKADSEYQALGAKQKQAQEIVWSARGKIQRCLELEEKKKEKEKVLALASKEERLYRDLAQAFGKKGIQALLIEMALPEIEVEANELLSRMTDNRMHVKIETQRETKRGDVIETLDINISDELGTRNYEMFSGGEAFRINFAIRIALSKLLARRAGAPLPTLIVDEGFGTQDSTGVEKIKEAINSIQDDFDKILVITHIEELRDAFPTRIDVIKTAEGSELSIS